MPDPDARPVTGPPWGAAPPEGADTALGLAARLGAYCWAEQQLFALFGGWVQSVPEADVKLVLAEHADHAAWRARRWHELLPTAPPGPDALVSGPAAVADAVAGAAAVADTVERLAIAYRVLVPRLVGALAAHGDWSSPLTEPAVGRVLAMCLGDLTADWTTGERVLQALAVGPGELERANASAVRTEGPIAAAGGLLGPGTTGLRPTGGGS